MTHYYQRCKQFLLCDLLQFKIVAQWKTSIDKCHLEADWSLEQWRNQFGGSIFHFLISKLILCLYAGTSPSSLVVFLFVLFFLSQ